MLVLKWIWDNKEWLFSGAGIAFIGLLWWVFQGIRNRRQAKPEAGNAQMPASATGSGSLDRLAVALGLLVLIAGTAGSLGLSSWIVSLFSDSSQVRREGTLLMATASVKYGEIPFTGGGRTGYWPEEGFLFASGKAVSPEMADFFLEAPGETPPGGSYTGGVSRLEFQMQREGSRICLLGPADFDALAEAPDPKMQTGYSRSGVPVRAGEVYVFSLDDGKFWGKLKVLECDGTPSRGTVRFQYILQQNGTRKLSQPQSPQ
jgi:hypothetical protein